MKRAIFTLFFLGILIYAPWWIVCIVAVSGTFLFPWYVEVIVAGLLFDLLYGALGLSLFGFGILGFVTAVVLFFGIQKIKENLR